MPGKTPSQSSERDAALIAAALDQIHVRDRRRAFASTGDTDATFIWRQNRQHEPAPTLPGYEILREIHRGGQGVVYLARQMSTRREVAVKFVHEGPLVGLSDRRRFEREVEILAHLDHPHIVTIHDSGVHDGYLWLAMDYIPGEQLLTYARTHELPLRQRLQLFTKVCDAVHAAHLRGVIHRDLKPGNIRVREDGEPFVLDFGLAKQSVIDTSSADAGLEPMTETGQFLGSLPWASPEQAEGGATQADVRSDVYALGVMLYQLVTERFPYPVGGSPREILDHIVSTEPTPPRRFTAVDRDLETVALRTLQKSPDRRYQSAGALSRDLRNWLSGAPIDARRDSPAYVVRKLLQRHRVAVGVAAAFVLLLAITATGMTALYFRAEREAADAREKFRLAREAATALVETSSTRLDGVLGASDVRAELLRDGYDRLSQLMADERSDLITPLELAEAEYQLGTLQLELNDAQAAARHFAAARATLPDGIDATTEQSIRARAWIGTARTRLLSEQRDEAFAALQKALVAAPSNGSLGARIRTTAHWELARLSYDRGALATASQQLDQVDRAVRTALASDDLTAQRELAVRSLDVRRIVLAAGIADQRDAPDEAQALIDRAEAQAHALIDDFPSERAAKDELARVFEKRAELAQKRGRRDVARDAYAAAADHWRILAAADPMQAAFQMGMATNLLRSGELLRQTGDAAAATEQLETAAAIFDRLSAAEPRDAQFAWNRAYTYAQLGDLHVERDNPEHARRQLELAYRITVDLLERNPDDPRALRLLDLVQTRLGDIALREGDLETAQTHFAAWYERARAAGPRSQTRDDVQGEAYAATRLAEIAERRGQMARAAALREELHELNRMLIEAEPDNLIYRADFAASGYWIARQHLERGEYEVARDVLDNALSHARVASTSQSTDVRVLAVESRLEGLLQRTLRKLGDDQGSREALLRKLELDERLVDREPENRTHQLALSIDYAALGDNANRRENWESAADYYRQAAGIRRALVEAEPRNPQYRQMVASAEHRLAAVAEAEGDTTGHLEHADRALVIMEDLHATYPNYARYREELSLLLQTRGDALENQENLPAACADYTRSLTHHTVLCAANPANPRYREWFATAARRLAELIGEARESRQLADVQPAQFRDALREAQNTADAHAALADDAAVLDALQQLEAALPD